MNESEEERAIRRILVALDASPPSLAALRAAAQLAADLDAELVGIYVEDINLLRLSDLPFAREVLAYTLASRQLNRERVERQLRMQARLARRAMEEIAQRLRLRWTFHVSQGLITNELLEAAQESDLILIGNAGWSRRKRLGSTARVFAVQAPRHTLIIQEGAHLGLPVGVVYDGSPPARKTLDIAASLLRIQEGFLIAFILADHIDEARSLQSDISEWARSKELHVHYHWLVDSETSYLVELVRDEKCGALVLSAETLVFHEEEALAEFLDQIGCPVLLVR
jgi:nucleotide-binding universal stress UspA family protein